MDESELQSRLSQIGTRWSLLAQVHAEDVDAKRRAVQSLFQRYHRAAYRYLVAMLRSADAADDVFQEFSLRLLAGGFREVSAEKGRFRHYLKTALRRLVIDHHRRQKRVATLLDQEQSSALEDESSETEDFDDCWRRELIDNVWHALRQYQDETGRPYATALRLRSENLDWTSKELAAALTAEMQAGKQYTDVAVRQIVHRAREQFANLLIREVEQSLETDHLDDIEAELAAFDLLSYCRDTIAARRGQRSSENTLDQD